MRSTILGFNQTEAVELGLNTDDLLILDYIIRANGNPEMCHILNDGVSYVWLSHKKIHEDLPILNMAESTLKNKLAELKKFGLIESKQIQNNIGRGSQTYYSVTTKTIEMTTSHQKYVVNEEPRTSTSTSNNKLISNDNKDNIISINTNNTEFLQSVQSTKNKRGNLYSKCYDQILEFTNNVGLIDALTDYLQMRLQMKDKPLYANSWKGMLKKLADMDNQIDVVNTSIERGWASFYPPKSKGKAVFGEDDNIKSVKGEFISSGEIF